VKVRGKWSYLYRAVDKLGNTIDFYLSPTRNTAAAKRFLAKALRGLKDWEQPEVINTDKAPTYAAALAELKAEGKCPKDTQHRQVKYLNNIVEADHGKLKQLIRPVRGFKSMKTASTRDRRAQPQLRSGCDNGPVDTDWPKTRWCPARFEISCSDHGERAFDRGSRRYPVFCHSSAAITLGLPRIVWM
jgi:DDE domain